MMPFICLHVLVGMLFIEWTSALEPGTRIKTFSLKRNSEYDNRIKNAFILEISTKRSVFECFLSCVSDVTCQTFFFNTWTKRCQTHFKKFRSAAGFTTSVNSTYYDVIVPIKGKVLTRCEQIKSCADPPYTDGEYRIVPPAWFKLGHAINIYCFGMSTGSSQSYITLPEMNVMRGNLLVQGTQFGTDCRITAAEPLEFQTVFNKIAVNVQTMKIDTKDLRFITHNGFQFNYGEFYHCNQYSSLHPITGYSTLNTNGTGARFDPQIGFKIQDGTPSPFTVSPDGHVINISADLVPCFCDLTTVNDLGLTLVPSLIGSVWNSAIIPECRSN